MARRAFIVIFRRKPDLISINDRDRWATLGQTGVKTRVDAMGLATATPERFFLEITQDRGESLH